MRKIGFFLSFNKYTQKLMMAEICSNAILPDEKCGQSAPTGETTDIDIQTRSPKTSLRPKSRSRVQALKETNAASALQTYRTGTDVL